MFGVTCSQETLLHHSATAVLRCCFLASQMQKGTLLSPLLTRYVIFYPQMFHSACIELHFSEVNQKNIHIDLSF